MQKFNNKSISFKPVFNERNEKDREIVFHLIINQSNSFNNTYEILYLQLRNGNTSEGLKM